MNVGIFWERDEHAPAYIVKWEGPVSGSQEIVREGEECAPLTTPRTAGCDGDPELTVPSHYRFKAGWGALDPLHPHYFTAGRTTHSWLGILCPTADDCANANHWVESSVVKSWQNRTKEITSCDYPMPWTTTPSTLGLTERMQHGKLATSFGICVTGKGSS